MIGWEQGMGGVCKCVSGTLSLFKACSVLKFPHCVSENIHQHSSKVAELSKSVSQPWAKPSDMDVSVLLVSSVTSNHLQSCLGMCVTPVGCSLLWVILGSYSSSLGYFIGKSNILPTRQECVAVAPSIWFLGKPVLTVCLCDALVSVVKFYYTVSGHWGHV